MMRSLLKASHLTSLGFQRANITRNGQRSHPWGEQIMDTQTEGQNGSECIFDPTLSWNLVEELPKLPTSSHFRKHQVVVEVAAVLWWILPGFSTIQQELVEVGTGTWNTGFCKMGLLGRPPARCYISFGACRIQANCVEKFYCFNMVFWHFTHSQCTVLQYPIMSLMFNWRRLDEMPVVHQSSWVDSHVRPVGNC